MVFRPYTERDPGSHEFPVFPVTWSTTVWSRRRLSDIFPFPNTGDPGSNEDGVSTRPFVSPPTLTGTGESSPENPRYS